MLFRSLDIVKNNGNHLLTLINDLLDVSKLQSGDVMLQKERFDIGTVVSEVQAVMSPVLSSKKQRLKLVGDLAGEEVVMDRTRIVQVMMNFISNAHKYSPSGTTITVECKIVEGNLDIAVIDQGMGISETDLARLFTKFFRVDNEATRSVSGTGLGLAITKEIIEVHEGTITVASTVGTGTTFSFSIPIDAVATAPDSVVVESDFVEASIPAEPSEPAEESAPVFGIDRHLAESA